MDALPALADVDCTRGLVVRALRTVVAGRMDALPALADVGRTRVLVVRALRPVVAGRVRTFPLVTRIQSTRVSIVVARYGIVLLEASVEGIAVIICAEISVIAIQGQTDANACLALAIVCARAAVIAANTVHCHGIVQASLFAPALILGARIAVVALHAVVGLTITVVVDAIADLFRRGNSRAPAQPLLRAHPPPGASPELICHFTAGLGFLRHGELGARALPPHKHALAAGLSFGRVGFLALVACRTRSTIVAAGSAEGPNSGLVHCAFAASEGIAIVAVRAGQAQAGKQGDAHKDRVSAAPLLARPSVRASRLAEGRADFLPHVQETQPRGTVIIVNARASGAGVGRRAGLRGSHDVELWYLSSQVEEVGKTSIDLHVGLLDLPHLGLAGTIRRLCRAQ